MSMDFASMLKDTLEKMKERFEFANSTWEGNDAAMLKRFEEVTSGNK